MKDRLLELAVKSLLFAEGVAVGEDMVVVSELNRKGQQWILGFNDLEAEVIMKPHGPVFRSTGSDHGYSHRFPVADPDFVNKVKQVLRGQGR